MTSSSAPEHHRSDRGDPFPVPRIARPSSPRRRGTAEPHGGLTALCPMGVALMGIPISAILTPLLLAALFLIGDLLNLLLPHLRLAVGHPDSPTGRPEPGGHVRCNGGGGDDDGPGRPWRSGCMPGVAGHPRPLQAGRHLTLSCAR